MIPIFILYASGLNYIIDLRLDGVPSLNEALSRIEKQAEQTPNPHWIRVVVGWSEFQFNEKRHNNNISNMQKGLCPCCYDFFSY